MTISLDGLLERRLREQASARRQSAEEAAVAMLVKGLDKADDEALRRSNQRRAELITREVNGGLSSPEAEELARLDAELRARLAPIDGQLLAVAEEFHRLAGGLPDAP